MADLVATRSTCLRRAVGAVAVRGRRVLATGYNGAPSGLEHCEIAGCLRVELNVPSGERHELCRAAHAEQNLLAQAAAYGICVHGATVYCTTQPCSICAKMLINVGIERVVFREAYNESLGMDLLRNAGVTLEVVP